MAGLLAGLRVADLTDASGHHAGRIFADLGAQVVLVEPANGSPDRRLPPLVPSSDGPVSAAFFAFNAGKHAVALEPGDPALRRLLQGADVVLLTTTSPYAGPGGPQSSDAPGAQWVVLSPFGSNGPRAGWRSSDLTLVAAGGGLYPTGDPDRPPVRCSEPTSRAHCGPEVVIAALTAVASGRPQTVDVSAQEALQIANMTWPAQFPRDGNRGRRRGTFTGRTRETWPCRDGWVSFGLRGGGARVKNLQTFARLAAEAGVATPAVTDRDWTTYDAKVLPDDELEAISEVVLAFFARHTMAELYAISVDTGLMLAPANSPVELLGSVQLAAREFFTQVGGVAGLPRSFVRVSDPTGPAADLVQVRGPAPAVGGPPPQWERRPAPGGERTAAGAWSGTCIVEFGSGAAGPVATRYFADHGATVVRVESTTRPDFLRLYALGPHNPHGLEGSSMFAGLNAGKLGVTLDMKNPAALEVALRLIDAAHAVTENFAPGAMTRWGLGYDVLSARRPELVLLSASLQGATGPHRSYPGFGGQGSALCGYTYLTGWPDRAPVGPFGTITDSLAPRYGAAALAAALLRQRRTGLGVWLDLSQVEAAAYSLSPWLISQAVHGRATERLGNRHARACPHGVFPCAGRDRWVALAVWDDEEWQRLADLLGDVPGGLAGARQRHARIDEVEQLVGRWTRGRSARDMAEQLQGLGLDAYEVLDWGDLHEDPQLAERGHFVQLEHPVLGAHLCEQMGFRLTATPGGVRRPAPTLGQHNEQVLCGLLGLGPEELAELQSSGALT